MLRKALKIFVIILLIGFVSVFIRGYEYQVSKSNVKNEVDTDISQIPIKEVSDETNIKEELATSKEEINNNNQQKENIETSKPSETATSKPSTTSIPKPSATPNNNSTSTNEQATINDNSSSNVEVKPWDRLGISEYDYYHKPAWSWQSIDFILNGTGNNACTSMDDCRKKCQEYGDQYLLEHDGSYSCDNVNSYSGDYLGEDFSFKEL